MRHEALTRYRELLDKVDEFTKMVLRAYRDDISCRKGCDECCRRSFSVFAVEARNLKEGFGLLAPSKRRLILKKLAANDPAGLPCVLLEDGGCMLYGRRPIICRTHGLPVRSRLITINGRAVTALCTKNFGAPSSLSVIRPEHVLDLDTLNTVLSSVNLLYLKEKGTPKGVPSDTGRVHLPDILAG